MRFTVLGPVEVVDGGRRHTVRRAQARGLFALLLLEAGRPVSSHAIEEALWAGAAPPTARTQVHGAISSVRALLSQLGAEGVVTGGTFGYQLAISPEQVDVHQFDRLTRLARAATEPAEGVRLLREALALWRGEPLADAGGAYVPATRAQLVERQLAAIEDLADLELRLGRPAEVAAELGPWVAANPLRERLRARLLIALHRCGRQAEAVHDYHAYRKMLAEQEGLDPGAELTDVVNGILRDDPHAAGGSGAAPASIPAQLPADVPEFTGRAGHLKELDALMPGARDRPTPPVVISAIDGMAGVGKTSLAVHWGWRNRRLFPDGQLYLNLRGYADLPPLTPLDAVGQLLYALGVDAGNIPIDLDAAAAQLRSLVAEKRILLVLDNAHSADQVRPLLPGSDRCVVLVTSRNQLSGLVAREGARRLLLDVLSADESYVLLRQILGPDRVDAETDATAELAALCAHLPLALRIAAANVAERPDLPISGYVADMSAGNRLAGLEIADDPQATVRAAFELSYRSLSDDVRDLFGLLGLLPGHDLTQAAVAALAGLPDVPAELAELVRTHLVLELEPGRFTLHDLLRAYARECAEHDLTAAQRTTATRRLFEHYLSIVDAAAALGYPQTVRLTVDRTADAALFTDTAGALAWLQVERGNLVAAVLAAAPAGLPEFAWRLADALRGYFWICRYTDDWLATAQAGLAAAGEVGDTVGRAVMRLSLGVAQLSLARYDEAVNHLEVALGHCREAGWVEGEGSCLGSLAITFAEAGDLHRAIDTVGQTLVLNRRLGRTASEAVQLGNRANMWLILGDLHRSAADFEESLELYRQTGNRGGEAIVLGALGQIRYYQAESAAALELLDQAVRLSQEIGDRYGEAIALASAAMVHAALGQSDLAAEQAEAALALAREIGDRKNEIGGLVGLGLAARAAGDPVAAATHFSEAVQLARATGHRNAQSEALVGLAESQRELGALDEALTTATEALTVARTDGYQLFEGVALTALAGIHLARGEAGRAIELAQEALACHRDSGYRLAAQQTEALLGAAPRRHRASPLTALP